MMEFELDSLNFLKRIDEACIKFYRSILKIRSRANDYLIRIVHDFTNE